MRHVNPLEELAFLKIIEYPDGLTVEGNVADVRAQVWMLKAALDSAEARLKRDETVAGLLTGYGDVPRLERFPVVPVGDR